MTRITKVFMIGFLALVAFAPLASARPRFVVVGGGFYGPAFYGPAWYGPGPYGYYYAPVPKTGSVKIESKMKDASVFVDGGFAGTVAQLKKFQLRPGNHNIELQDPSGHSFYQERIDVISGKTIKIFPDVRG